MHKTLKPFQGVYTCCIHSTYFNTSRRNYATEDLVLSNNKLVFNKSIDKPTIARTVGEHELLYIQQPDMPANPRQLKVSVLGAPNAGKSSLVNRLMNRRVSAVSNKINTTRNRINAVLTDQDTQIIILDTPGITSFKKSKKFNLERQMIIDPHSSLWESDLVLVIHDVSNEYSCETLDSEVLKCLFSHPEKEAILVLNKTDKLKTKKKLLDLVAKLTGGCLNGKEFLPEKEKHKSKFDRKTLRDSDYEALFAKTAQKMNLKLEDEKTRKVYQLLDELKACEEYLLKNQSDIRLDTGDESQLEKLGEERISKEKLSNDYMPSVLNASNEINQSNELSIINSIAKSSSGENTPILRRIEDISPIEFKKDLMQTTDWHMYYKKLSSLATLVRGKTYWPYFNQVFMISAKFNDGVDDLKRYMFSRAKPGEWIFSRNLLTDQMPQEIAEMCVREKMLEYLPDEIPYELGLKTSHWELDDNDCLNIIINVIPGSTKYKYNRHVKELFRNSGRLIRIISEQAHQEMLNTFQCEIKFKLAVITHNNKF